MLRDLVRQRQPCSPLQCPWIRGRRRRAFVICRLLRWNCSAGKGQRDHAYGHWNFCAAAARRGLRPWAKALMVVVAWATCSLERS
jgi:hypothetical protein